MTDEKYVFISDSFDKKRIARGAFNKRTHTGRGGKMKMPSDYLTRKEREAMNGECISYRLNEPMKWAEFRTMPDDVKKTYILALRNKFNVSDSLIFRMMDIDQRKGAYEINRLGIGLGRGVRRVGFDKDGWEKWCAGIKEVKIDAEEIIAAGEEPVVEMVAEEPAVEAVAELPTEKKRLSPLCGHVTLCGTPTEIAETIASFLGSECIKCEVIWEVV